MSGLIGVLPCWEGILFGSSLEPWRSPLISSGLLSRYSPICAFASLQSAAQGCFLDPLHSTPLSVIVLVHRCSLVALLTDILAFTSQPKPIPSDSQVTDHQRACKIPRVSMAHWSCFYQVYL